MEEKARANAWMYLGCPSLDVCLWWLGRRAEVWCFILGLDVGSGEIWLPLPSFVACEVVGNKGGD